MEKVNLKEEKRAKREEKKRVQAEYMADLQNNPVNKGSGWLNFIAFFIPVWGIFAAFFNLVKRPKRAKSLFVTCTIAFILQGAFLLFCYMFLFDYLGRICITMFG